MHFQSDYLFSVATYDIIFAVVRYIIKHLLSRQTESVRDHKFHSGYAHSSMVYR